ncbi:MAG: OpgC domain-containing protein [Acidobacteria bacterium]|nr:OpgC domain-containing protein [Acidobacteriota bacterium]
MQRDLSLDSFRGLCLAVMTIDHLVLPLSSYTLNTLGFISAAEFFVFLSGYIAGIVYTKIKINYGSSGLWQAAINRAKSIYLAHIIVFLLIFITGLKSNVFLTAWKSNIFNFSDPLMFNDPKLGLFLGLLLLYQPTFLDILPLYFVFLLLTPIILEQLLKNRHLRVLFISLGFWLTAQFGVLGLFSGAISKFLPIFLGGFDILAWQIIFVLGLYIGFLKYQGLDLNSLLNKKLLALSFSLVVAFFLVRHDIVNLTLTTNSDIFSKEKLGLLRLINFAAIVYLLGAVKSYFGKFLELQWLSQLGQHSLHVYAFHVGMIFLLAPLTLEINSLPNFLGLFVTFLIVLSLSIPAKIHQLYRNYSQENLDSIKDDAYSIKA